MDISATQEASSHHSGPLAGRNGGLNPKNRKAVMFPRFSAPYHHAAFTPAPAGQVSRLRQPFHGEPAFRTLAPGIEFSNEHAVSTGESNVRLAQWVRRNTVDIGIVNEDVAGVTLSGQHTFPDHVLDQALESQRRNPGLILYLGIPPNNPQKYVPVLPHLGQDAGALSAFVMPLSIPMMKRPQRSEMRLPMAESAARIRHPMIRRFTADASAAGGDQTSQAIAAPNSQAFTSVQHAGFRPHERVNAPILSETSHGSASLQRTRPVADLRLRLGSPSPLSSINAAEEASTSSTGRNAPLSEAAIVHEPPLLSNPVDWTQVREQLTRASVPEPDPSWLERQRNARRARYGIAPRTGKTAAPAAARQASPENNDIDPDSIFGIQEENMHAVATRILRRAAETSPGHDGKLERQNRWLDLLNMTWSEYQKVVAVIRGEASQHSEAWLWAEMRYSLRELLHLSEEANVFGFEGQAQPGSDEELNAFVSSHQFELLVTAVNDVHDLLQRERSGIGGAVPLEDSPRRTVTDQQEFLRESSSPSREMQPDELR